MGGGLRSGHPLKSVLQLTNLDSVTRKWTGLSRPPILTIFQCKLRNGRWARLWTRSPSVRNGGSTGVENPARSSKEMGENPIRRMCKGSLFSAYLTRVSRPYTHVNRGVSSPPDRASMGSNSHFTLRMHRSLGFGSYKYD